MTTTLRARFDGKVFIPDEPVNLPAGEVALEVTTTDAPPLTPLQRLYEMVKDLPFDPDSPTDGAAQHDHYLYGTPKRP